MDKLVEANQRALDLQYMLDSAQQEIERLRSQSVEQVFRRKNEEIAAKDARIKELEEANRNIDKRRDEMAAFIERLEAAFLRSNAAMRYYQEGNRGPWPQLGEKFKEPYQEKAREALKRIKEGGKSA